MTKKIFHAVLICAIVSVIACAGIVSAFLYNYFGDQINESLMSEAKLVAEGVEAYGGAYLESISKQNRVTWINSDGTVLYDSSSTVNEMENHDDREEVLEALESGEGESRRYSNTMLEQTYYSAVKLSDGTVIRVASSSDSFLPVLFRMIWTVVLLFAVVILLSVFPSRMLARRVVRPINEIDLEKPDIREDYVELAPLLHKISRQNQLIATQMSDLKRRQEEFRAITENMGEGLIVVDGNAEILSFNKSALKLLDAEGVTYGTSVLSLSRSNQFVEAVQGAIEGRRSKPVLHHGSKYLRIFASPVVVEGSYSGAVIVILDVTDSEEKESMKREFTSNVSHELKTPLTSIYGISEIMAGGIVKPEDMRSFAKNINDESGRLIRLVNDIIKLSQLDEGSTTLEKERISLMAVAKEVRERLRIIYEKSNIIFKVEGEDVYVSGVPGILSEMLYNLCDNAIKYNRDGGSVTVTVGKRGDHPFLRVTDTGIGIPPEAKERVFERFYRVDKSHSREIGGTGLGLSIVKHAAAFHNAKISLESKLGEGTTVEIKF